MKHSNASVRARTPSRSRFDAGAQVFTLSRAKVFLGRLTEKALKGESVYILDGRHRFLLQPVEEVEPIPKRPAGYFQLDRDDIDLDRRLASASTVANPNKE